MDYSSSSSTPKQLFLDSKIDNNEVAYAEIRWVLKTIIISGFSGFSMNSVDDVFDAFQEMFPDRDIATTMKQGCAKATYTANFGKLPYVLMLLHGSIKKPTVCILSFDKSLNKVTHECKMDLIIRDWDDDNKKTGESSIFTVKFLDHFNAKDLMTQFEKVTNKLVSEKLYQISMNGRKVNMKFYRGVEQNALKFLAIHLLIWTLVVCTLCMALLNLWLKVHPGASKTS